MAYNVEKLAKLGALKELGLKQKAVDEAQNKRIKALEDVGAQANVLEGVKVNGVALAIAEKMVDILVATGSKNGSISVAGTDVAIKGLAALAYKAKISQSDLDDALAAVLAAKADKATTLGGYGTVVAEGHDLVMGEAQHAAERLDADTLVGGGRVLQLPQPAAILPVARHPLIPTAAWWKSPFPPSKPVRTSVRSSLSRRSSVLTRSTPGSTKSIWRAYPRIVFSMTA